MDNAKLLERIKSKTGGRIDCNERGFEKGFARHLTPELVTYYRDREIRILFHDRIEIVFKVFSPFGFFLLLTRETFISRFMDRISLSPEVKCGIRKFDEKYLIQNMSEENVKKVMTESVFEIIESMEPFIKIEFKPDSFEIIRQTDEDVDYDANEAIKDLDKIFGLIESIENNFRS